MNYREYEIDGLYRDADMPKKTVPNEIFADEIPLEKKTTKADFNINDWNTVINTYAEGYSVIDTAHITQKSVFMTRKIIDVAGCIRQKGFENDRMKRQPRRGFAQGRGIFG